MAASLVGGAFLSATVQTLVEKLASTEFRDYIKNNKLNESLLAEIETTLRALQAVLNDAEQKQIVDPAVKDWLDRLKDVIFDAEDLLDQINYDSLRCKMENTGAENITNQVRNYLSCLFKNFYGEINSQMKNVCRRLQFFVRERDIIGLQIVSGRISRRTPTSPVVNESVMVGRKDDKEKLMNMLLSESGTGNNNIGVVAILGMGGVGKTTLAQLLYNDEEVQKHFDLKAWVCVSEDFDILRVTKSLLESIPSRANENNNLDIRAELKQNLRDKRFLFVLDDLWNDNYNDWEELVTPLISGKSESRVIITTRQQRVAEFAHPFSVHKLEPLSDEYCWSLLSKHACGSDELYCKKNPNLEAIGRKIARKCGGLPIAAKTLGGLMRSKVDAKEWTAILNNDIWNLRNDNILPALLLSYQYLPSHLKRCFAYCSIFPKDYPLDRKQLVLLWMAEGFLNHSEGEKAMDEVGNDIFDELLSRSLIQQSNDDVGKQKFVMHDLVNDLATFVSGKSCCRLECGNISKNVRHLSYNREEYDTFKKFEDFYDFKCLRSFLPIGDYYWWSLNYLSKKVVDDLLPTLRRLRVLSLSKYDNINMVPDSIGNLVHLRYLDLSRTKIKSLPDTTCNLYNLQTLILSQCQNLTELPVHIGKLIELRHLDVSETNLKEMPMQIVGLENLQTLTVFVVGNQEIGLSVKELGKFPNLWGKLCIKNLHNVIDAIEAFDANLKGKEHIEELELQWGKLTEDSRTAKAVLDVLRPSINLKKLSIVLYGGTSFSSWLGDSSFSNMVYLCISKCEYCITLPPLGQLPSLKELRITDMTMLETVGPEFYGMLGAGSNSSFQPFPSLEVLEFENMSNWKEWFPFEGGKFPFPHLETLRLRNCPELSGQLPSHLSSIQLFGVTNCDRLLATPSTLRWLSLTKRLHIDIGDLNSQGDLPTKMADLSLLESDSPCLLQDVRINCSYNTVLLPSLPKMILSTTCLQHLYLFGLSSLTAFPADGLPTSLQTLTINGCNNLAFLPPETWSNYTSLVTLGIWYSCDALTSFPLDGFPVLQTLWIIACGSLESIFISESSFLRPSTLQSLSVGRCDALRSLPQRMDTLTALEELNLSNLPQLNLSFCEGACLPPKLRSIYIISLGITTPVAEWGLQCLTALSSLYIEGDDIVNALLQEQLLPISLVSLEITNLSKTKSLEGNGLRHLSSLETLCFCDCSGLESLAEVTMPSSLKSLTFFYCPRLESLPEDKFPSSLKLLSISSCPLLEARYESQKEGHWSNIAHIPVIKINNHVMI